MPLRRREIQVCQTKYQNHRWQSILTSPKKEIKHRVKDNVFQLISWWEGFLETDSSFRFLGESSENLKKLSVYGKFPQQKISWKNLYFTC